MLIQQYFVNVTNTGEEVCSLPYVISVLRVYTQQVDYPLDKNVRKVIYI
jgi:hypothetical protein